MAINNLLVVTNPSNWKIRCESVEVVSAKEYLAREQYHSYRSANVFNLCRSYAYQSLGYYVSLLAEARGHRPVPSVATISDFRSLDVVRSFAEDIAEVIKSALSKIEEKEYTLPIIFGQALQPEMKAIAQQLYRLFPAPLLRAQFIKKNGGWQLDSVSPMSLNALPEGDRERIEQLAQNYFSQPRIYKPQKSRYLYDLAIVVNPNEKEPPSNPKALKKIEEAAHEVGFYVEQITTADIGRINEFDAVFIRETTAVNKPIYKLSRLAYAEGLVVIDDPWSILRSTNKVYLAESLAKAKIPMPKSWILTREDLRSERLAAIALPCVLKQPDGAFSQGVHKANTPEELQSRLAELLKSSEMVVAQAFMPSDFDWRIGILDGQPFYACKYFMAGGHWQIYNWEGKNEDERVGNVETLHTEFVPKNVLQTAVKAAKLIGNGLYGVDLKQIDNQVYVIEVNDNPSLDSGVEDLALGAELYRRIARSFRRRIELDRGLL